MRGGSDVLPINAGNSGSKRVPLVAHIIYRLDVGGLENGLVNLINHIPEDRYTHAIICLTSYSDFRLRLRNDAVKLFALNKPPGIYVAHYGEVWRLLRTLKPDIVHTRNLAALECMLAAWLAGVPVRVHGEHGWDVPNLNGGSRKQQWVRLALRPFVHHYIAVSRDLAGYLEKKIAIPGRQISQIYNGVDTTQFYPAPSHTGLEEAGFDAPDLFVIGTVGRMEAVKDQLTLARAFIHLVRNSPEARRRARLAMIGEGSLLAEARAMLASAGVTALTWLPGARNDVPELMRGFDLFVLPSLAEGVSNTILEAMASGLPVVATNVGGNPELVEDGTTGRLISAADPPALAAAMSLYMQNPSLARQHGLNGRSRTVAHFSMNAMVSNYLDIYDRLTSRDLGGAILTET